MRIPITVISAYLLLVTVVAAQQASSPTPAGPKLTGRWRVTFSLQGDAEKHLIFEPKAKGSGSLMLLDTGPDNKPVPDPAPAAWSQLTNNRVSFSGETELPLGTCCREIGTLIFKGKFQSRTSIAGRIIFVTSIDEEESPYKLSSRIGTFSATLMN